MTNSKCRDRTLALSEADRQTAPSPRSGQALEVCPYMLHFLSCPQAYNLRRPRHSMTIAASMMNPNTFTRTLACNQRRI